MKKSQKGEKGEREGCEWVSEGGGEGCDADGEEGVYMNVRVMRERERGVMREQEGMGQRNNKRKGKRKEEEERQGRKKGKGGKGGKGREKGIKRRRRRRTEDKEGKKGDKRQAEKNKRKRTENRQSLCVFAN